MSGSYRDFRITDSNGNVLRSFGFTDKAQTQVSVAKSELNAKDYNIKVEWSSNNNEFYNYCQMISKEKKPEEPEKPEKSFEEIKEYLEELKKYCDEKQYSGQDTSTLQQKTEEVRKYKQDNQKVLEKYEDKLRKEGLRPFLILNTVTSLVNNKIENNEYKEQTLDDSLKISEQYINPTPAITLQDMATDVVAVGKTLIEIASIILMILTIIMAVKFLTANADDKGNLKQQLVGLIISTAVIFGAYIIWDFAIKVATSIIK